MKKKILAIVMTLAFFISAMQGAIQVKAGEEDPTKPVWYYLPGINPIKWPWQSAYDELYIHYKFKGNSHPNWVKYEESMWNNETNVRIAGNFKYFILSETEKTAALWGVLKQKKKIVIPEYIDGYKIIGIGADTFYEQDVLEKSDGKYYDGSGHVVIGDSQNQGKNSVEEIVLPKGIKYIGGAAFYGCKTLKKINLDLVEKRIDEAAFFKCISLKKIYIPENVIIENKAFWGCISLMQVTLAPGVLTHNNCFGGGYKIPKIICQSQKVYYAAFDEHVIETELEKPNDETEVVNWVFDSPKGQWFDLRSTMTTMIIRAKSVRVKKNVPALYYYTDEEWKDWKHAAQENTVVEKKLIIEGKQTKIKNWPKMSEMEDLVLSTVPKAKCISWAKKLHVTYQTTAITKQAKKVIKKGRKVTWKKASATIKKYTYGKNKKWKKKTKKGKVTYRIYGKKTKSAKYIYVKQTKKTQAQVPYKYVKVKAEAVIE